MNMQTSVFAMQERSVDPTVVRPQINCCVQCAVYITGYINGAFSIILFTYNPVGDFHEITDCCGASMEKIFVSFSNNQMGNVMTFR